MDATTLLAAVGGNRALLQQMARLCLHEDAPRLRAQLHSAAKSGDSAGVEHAAHALKGLFAEFRAEAARSAAAAIELAARHRDLVHVTPHIDTLEREYERLAALLRSIVEQSTP